MKALLICLFVLALHSGYYAIAQTSPSLDSESSPAPAPPSLASTPQLPALSSSPAEERSVSWKELIPNIASDQKRIWSFPARMVRGKNLLPVLGVVAATAGLVVLDSTAAQSFRRSTSFSGFNSALNGNNTALATVAIPVSFLTVGLVRKDSYAQHTALLVGEAVADAEILATVMQDFDRRLRPADVSPQGNFSDTWFEGKLSSLGGNGSFPSGHTIAAFSVATVLAHRYRTHRWVPYVAYGAAGLIGFSRISLSSHFPSDVFMGAALGYSITHFIVLRR